MCERKHNERYLSPDERYLSHYQIINPPRFHSGFTKILHFIKSKTVSPNEITSKLAKLFTTDHDVPVLSDRTGVDVSQWVSVMYYNESQNTVSYIFHLNEDDTWYSLTTNYDLTFCEKDRSLKNLLMMLTKHQRKPFYDQYEIKDQQLFFKSAEGYKGLWSISRWFD